MADAWARIEEWKCAHNQNRPQSAFGGLTPAEFAEQLKLARKVALNPDQRRGEIRLVMQDQSEWANAIRAAHGLDGADTLKGGRGNDLFFAARDRISYSVDAVKIT